MKINLVLDVDIILRSIYHRALTTRRTPEGIHFPCLQEWVINQEFMKMKTAIETVISERGYNEFKWFYCITDETNKYTNFRYQLSSDYKKNRKSEGNILDRLFLRAAKDSLVELLDTELRSTKSHIECDDEISIIASYLKDNSQEVIIVSADKDFTINFDTINPITLVYKERNEKKFYEMLLLGDAADGISKIPGWGEKTVEKLFEGKTLDEIKLAVEQTYESHGRDINLIKDLLVPLTNDQVTFDKSGRVIQIKLLSQTLTFGD